MAYLTSFAREHSHLSWLNIAGYRLLHSTSVSMVLSEACVTITWRPSLRLLRTPYRTLLARTWFQAGPDAQNAPIRVWDVLSSLGIFTLNGGFDQRCRGRTGLIIPTACHGRGTE